MTSSDPPPSYPPPTPRPSPSFRFYVPMLRAYAGHVRWAAAGQIGVEIQDLIHPDAVTPAMPDPIRGLEEFWGQALLGFSLPFSFHGPATTEPLYDVERRDSALTHLRRVMDAAAGL